ncbi:MAG: HEAT repeat domain-containing protein [Planctomycetes bacterium]|nr:HEAT repeat domain-containing protein [Planctomycetota bacterium]
MNHWWQRVVIRYGSLGAKNRNVRALGAYQDDKTIEFLIHCLSNREVVEAAAETLGAIGDGRAIDPLVKLLTDPRGHSVNIFGTALASIGGDEVQEELTKVLSTSGPESCVAAAKALTQFGNSEAIPSLVVAFERHSDRRTRRAIGSALASFGWKPNVCQSVSLAIAEMNWNRAAGFGATAIRPLLNALDRKSIQGSDIIQAVYSIKDPAAVETFVELLMSNTNSNQDIIIKALGRLQSPGAIEHLIPFLSSTNRETRFLTIDALKALNWIPASLEHRLQLALALRDFIKLIQEGPDALHAVLALLSSHEHDFFPQFTEPRRCVICDAICTQFKLAVGNPQNVPVLIEAVNSENSHVCRFGAQALLEMGDPVGADCVLNLASAEANYRTSHWIKLFVENELASGRAGLSKYNKNLRIRLFFACSKYSEAADEGPASIIPIVSLASRVGGFNGDEIMHLLDRVGGPDAVDPFLELLLNPDEQIREREHAMKYAAIRLGQLGETRAVDPLLSVLRDEHVRFEVRRAVANALSNLDWIPESNDDRVLVAVVTLAKDTLVKYGSGAVGRLIGAINTKNLSQDEGVFVISTLGLIGDPRASDTLLDLSQRSIAGGCASHEVTAECVISLLKMRISAPTSLLLGKQLEGNINFAMVLIEVLRRAGPLVPAEVLSAILQRTPISYQCLVDISPSNSETMISSQSDTWDRLRAIADSEMRRRSIASAGSQPVAQA